MESFNKVLSFIIGLIVVIILVVVITNRLSRGKNPIRFLPLQGTSLFKVKVTTSPTRKTTPLTPSPTGTRTIKVTKKPTLIPKTGPEFLLPLAFSTLGLGVFLRKRS
jgi:hypothetical protein